MRKSTWLQILTIPGLFAVSAVTSHLIANGGYSLFDPGPAEVSANVSNDVTGASITVSPDRPGSVATLLVQFTMSGLGDLEPDTSRIVFSLPKEWNEVQPFPANLSRDQITIRATNVSTPGAPCGPPCPSDTVPPQSVTVDFVGPENANPEVTLVLDDMLLGDTPVAAGAQGIAANATVTVVFLQAAGIRNPFEAAQYDLTIDTTLPGDNPVTVEEAVTIPIIMEMSTDAASRGATQTLVAQGVKDGQTTTFWLDVDGDGTRDANERDLCSNLSGNDFVATCSFSIFNPPFVPGRGPDCNFASLGATFNCNYINVRDGLGQTLNTFTQRHQADLDRTIFDLLFCGDQNDDGEVNVFDAIIDLQIIADLIEPDQQQQVLSDVVRDGRIDIFDVILTLQHIAGLTVITECGPLPG